MGTVANSNYGFKGTVSSAETPQVLGNGSLYSVEGEDDLEVTAGGAGDRAVTVAAGPNGAWGDGVLSKWTTGAVLNAAANTTLPTRWDTVVIRRTWTPAGSPTGSATLMILSGGSSVAIASGRMTDRGVTSSDQPIALVPIAQNSAAAGTPIDLRCWTGEGGGLVAEHVAALQYLGSKGTAVTIGARTYRRLTDGTGTPYWDTRPAASDRAVEFVRGDSGNFGPGSFVVIVGSGSLPSTAPAGLWQITFTPLLKNSPAASVYIRGMAGTTNLTGDVVVEVGTLSTFSVPTLFTHSGGALPLVLWASTTAGTGIAPPGSRITAVWLGPA